VDLRSVQRQTTSMSRKPDAADGVCWERNDQVEALTSVF
jgi:hypothetical protein